MAAPSWLRFPDRGSPRRLGAREARYWPLTDLPVLVIAVVAAAVLPATQPSDVPTAIALLVLLVAADHIRVPFGNGFVTATQPVFVALLVLEPARVAALFVLVAFVLGELLDVTARRRPLGRLPAVVGNCWFAVPPTVIVALAPAPVPWEWWAAAFLSQFAADVVMGHVRDRVAGATPMSWRDSWTPELFDLVVTLPALFACVQARGQAAAWVVPAGLLAISALLARERSGRECSEQLAAEDPLTGLLNRRLFEQLLGEAHARAVRADREGAVLIVDLDRFKDVNDELGHRVGDEVLREAARRLRGTVRAGDLVARLGGDEFGLVLCDGEGAARAALAIQDAFAEPMLVGVHRCELGVSVGAATFGRHMAAAEARELADRAMYAHKRVAAEPSVSRAWIAPRRVEYPSG